MNILFVANYYPTANQPSRGTFIKVQADAVARTGNDISVLHPVPFVPLFAKYVTSRADEFSNLPHYYNNNGIKIYQPRYFTHPKHLRFGKPDWFQFRSVQKLITSGALEKPDVIHGHFAMPSGALAKRLSEYWNVPYVVTLRGFDVHTWPKLARRNKQKFQSICQNANALLAVSQALADETFELSGRKADILTSGLNMEVLNKIKTLRSALYQKDKFNVVFAGYFIKRKGIQAIADAAEILEKSAPNIHITCVGDGDLRSLIDNKLNITLTGRKTHAQTLQYIKNADCLILPALAEGMPNVLLEAGALGTPVISTIIGGVNELLGDNERGIKVPTENGTALAKAIQNCCENPDQAEQRASLLQQHVMTHYDSDALAQRLIEIYKSL